MYFCNIPSPDAKLVPDFADWGKSRSRADNLHTAHCHILYKVLILHTLHISNDSSIYAINCGVQMVKLVWEWSDLRFTWYDGEWVSVRLSSKLSLHIDLDWM